jgi:predicted DNA-binding mobile mystery protein A
MLKRKKQILIDQLDTRIKQISPLKAVKPPSGGWIKSIRMALNMSVRQMGQKLNTTPQSASEAEQREIDGTITIKKMMEIAQAMNMQFVYGLIPNEGSLKAMIEKRAREIATEIVLRTNQNMALEDQATSDERIKKAIDERTQELVNEIPKLLWE